MCRKDLTAKLRRLGLEVDEQEIMSANYAGVLLLDQRGFKRCRLVLRPERSRLPNKCLQNPDAIVIGDIGNRWDYDLLNELMNQVLEGAEIIALHKGRYHQSASGLLLNGGAFVAALEHTTEKQAVVVGKPNPTFFELASDTFGCNPDELLMVGDDLINDMEELCKWACTLCWCKQASTEKGSLNPQLFNPMDVFRQSKNCQPTSKTTSYNISFIFFK